MGVRTNIVDDAATIVAIRQPHGRANKYNAEIVSRCWNSPKNLSEVSVVPKTSNQPARACRDPGPYRWRKSTLAMSPFRTRSGKTSMKPSSMEAPTARKRAGKAVATVRATNPTLTQLFVAVRANAFRIDGRAPATKTDGLGCAIVRSSCESDEGNRRRSRSTIGKIPTAARTHRAGSAGILKRVVP